MLRTRPVTMALNGMVASPHYLASLAGARMLADGGRAVDAAIAANAVLTVAYPTMCSIGGDCFMLIWDARARRLHAFNGSGASPRAMTRELLLARGLSTIPGRGGLAVSVPGTIDAWARVGERFGRLGLERSLRPAIGYAREGLPVTPSVNRWTRPVVDLLRASPALAGIYLDAQGQPLATGAPMVQAALAATLQRVAREGRGAFYDGEVARDIADAVREAGGVLAEEDLAAHEGEWCEPLATAYRGLSIYEPRPNSQGAVALLMLNILEGLDLPGMGADSADAVHSMVEARKLAFKEREAIADPRFVDVPIERFTDKCYAAGLRSAIDMRRAAPMVAPAAAGDTVYLCAADRDGNAVSLIQSVYFAYGACVMAPASGVVLQSRGAYFSLDERHPNRLEPGKRPLHTLMAGMAFQDGRPRYLFGTMGGDGQPPTHCQLLANLVDFGMDAQEAVEAPRWLDGRFFIGDPPDALNIEDRYPAETLAELERRGHRLNVQTGWVETMGHAQVIELQPSGLMLGGADPRGDGAALGV